MNEHDSQTIAAKLEADGLTRVYDDESADVLVYNTCTIRENADEKLYGTLGSALELKRAKPELAILVSGCQAQKDRGLIQKRAPHVDVVIGTHNVANAAHLLRQSRMSGPIMEILEESEQFPSALELKRDDAFSSWVTIQIGCDNACAFCIVPSVRGEEKSRPFGTLVDEISTLAGDGVSEITLLGQNVNSYGRDLTLAWREGIAGSDIDQAKAIEACGQNWADEGGRARPLFADLLNAASQIEGIKRVRYTSPHPKDLRPETIAAMANNDAVMPHLHFPVQSGSNEILAQMHRGYTVESYLKKLESAREAIADLAVTTDIIVGFPGESNEDFEATMELCATVGYDSAYTFIFSPRPGTQAFEFSDRFVPASVVSERFDRLKIVCDRTAQVRHEARIGRTEDVLVLGPSKRNPLITSGRTAQNKLIHFPYKNANGDQVALASGTYVKVLVTSSAAYFLRGELVEITATPRHKRRIPVQAI